MTARSGAPPGNERGRPRARAATSTRLIHDDEAAAIFARQRGRVVDLAAERRRRRGMRGWPESCRATWEHYQRLGLTSELVWDVLDDIARRWSA